MTVRRTRPRPKRSVSIPSLIAGVVADVLVGLMLVLIMPVDQYSPTFGEGEFCELRRDGVLRSSPQIATAEQKITPHLGMRGDSIWGIMLR
jgi:hypothetical protein